MKTFLGLALLVFVIVAGWRIGSTLNSDALGMAVGMFFGMLAGIPTALLLLLSGRRREKQHNNSQATQHGQPLEHSQMPYPQPPVIIVAGGQPTTAQPTMGAQQPFTANHLPPEQPPPHSDQQRKFRVVGESEEWLDEW